MRIKTFNSGTWNAKLIGSDIEVDFSVENNPTALSVENKLQEIKNKNAKCEIECTDMSAPPETIILNEKKALLQHNVTFISDYTLYIPLNKKFLVASAVTAKNGSADNGKDSRDWKNYPTQQTKDQFLKIMKTIQIDEDQ